MARRVECINKNDRDNPYERITHLGGSGWRITQGDVIAEIKSGEDFYVEEPLQDRVYLEVAVSAAGNEYVKTEADGDAPNNLLSLPECG
jgi:hypothetical protein